MLAYNPFSQSDSVAQIGTVFGRSGHPAARGAEWPARAIPPWGGVRIQNPWPKEPHLLAKARTGRENHRRPCLARGGETKGIRRGGVPPQRVHGSSSEPRGGGRATADVFVAEPAETRQAGGDRSRCVKRGGRRNGRAALPSLDKVVLPPLGRAR